MKDENLVNSVITLHVKDGLSEGSLRRWASPADVYAGGWYQTRYYVIPPPGMKSLLKRNVKASLILTGNLLPNYLRSMVISPVSACLSISGKGALMAGLPS